MIQRYTHNGNLLVPDSHFGEWVRYEDHVREMDALAGLLKINRSVPTSPPAMDAEASPHTIVIDGEP